MKRNQDAMDGDSGSIPSQHFPSGSDFVRLPKPAGMPGGRPASHHFERPQEQQISPPSYNQLLPAASSYNPSQPAMYNSQFQTSHSPASSSSSTTTAAAATPANVYSSRTGLAPMSPPPIRPLHSPTQAVNLLDLQHEVGAKSSALQTLQRDYDSLVGKLERQRTMGLAMERRIEASDIEVSTLAEDKEILQAQIAGLEAQVEELQQSRDEARRQIAANGSQYMKIVEMASLLQSQAAEERKKWKIEKDELQERIKILEEAMMSGLMPQALMEKMPRGDPGSSETNRHTPDTQSSTNALHIEHTISLLRSEIVKLRSKTQALEVSLRAVKEENASVQAAAQAIEKSGKRVQDTLNSVLGD